MTPQRNHERAAGKDLFIVFGEIARPSPYSGQRALWSEPLEISCRVCGWQSGLGQTARATAMYASSSTFNGDRGAGPYRRQPASPDELRFAANLNRGTVAIPRVSRRGVSLQAVSSGRRIEDASGLQ